MSKNLKIKNYTYEFYPESELGHNLFGVVDNKLGYSTYTTVAHTNTQYPSVIAFAGARYSRSALSINELLLEIKVSKKSAQAKLADIFKNYGHASVGDMAMLFAYLQNVPLISAFFFFYNIAVGAGQERSTRFQNYRNSSLMDLKFYIRDGKLDKEILNEYSALGDFALDKYDKYTTVCTKRYTEFFNPGDDPKNQAAQTARVFDTSRYWLLNGFRTSIAFITSARDWARIISEFKARESILYNPIGFQLENLFVPPDEVIDAFKFTPEAPDLIRHAEANYTIKENLKTLNNYLKKNTDLFSKVKRNDNFGQNINQYVSLVDSKEFTHAEVMLMQYILTIKPTFDHLSLLKYIKKLSIKKKKEISEIVFQGHNNYIYMDNMSRINCYSMLLNMDIGMARDLNRHRSFGRFTPMFEFPQNIDDYMNLGFTIPLYLSENKKFSDIKEEYVNDFSEYFKMLRKFTKNLKKRVDYDDELILSLLPMSTSIPFWMHGSPKEISYMVNQRVRPGGHINYRDLNYLISEEISKSDPLLSSLLLPKRPNALSREEFFDRS